MPDELPRSIEVESAGLRFRGFPALIDRGDSLSLRVLESPDTAEIETRQAQRRLFVWEHRHAIEYELTDEPVERLNRLSAPSLIELIVRGTREEVSRHGLA